MSLMPLSIVPLYVVAQERIQLKYPAGAEWIKRSMGSVVGIKSNRTQQYKG